MSAPRRARKAPIIEDDGAESPHGSDKDSNSVYRASSPEEKEKEKEKGEGEDKEYKPHSQTPRPKRLAPTAHGRQPRKRRRNPAPTTSTSTSTPTTDPPTTDPPTPVLRGVPDALGPSLICLLIGLNPGITTSLAGHPYAHPRNHFWRLLHSGGLTPDRVCPPSTDQQMPALYSLGLTNLVDRPTLGQSDLSRAEMAAGAMAVEAKVRTWRPESVCFVGKGIWEAVWRVMTGKRVLGKDFEWGWQEGRWGAGEGWEGARIYVVPSTSGLASGISMEVKRECWRVLGEWVQMRRGERGEGAPRVPVGEGEVAEEK